MYPQDPGFVRDSDTSKAAAESIGASKMRDAALGKISDSGREGMTSDELEVATGMRHQTASARIRELAMAGKVIDSGFRRRTRSGRTATVWVAP